MILALLGTTIPTFVIASVLQYALSVTWPVFPTMGYNGARYLVLPVLCMCLGPLATYARYKGRWPCSRNALSATNP